MQAVAPEHIFRGSLRRGQWPMWTILAAMWREPGDRGVGDTVERLCGGVNTERWKRHHEAVFGVFARPCGGQAKVADWNRRWPYL